ncbi:MAG: zinc-binding dehydrogenase [Microbacterium sp.]|uniref:zinc-binding dehydrogenase n=1 Tax=Microbacterium sp. TaxID=51671 RepID=UPI00261DFB5A|nr:zinc-binding dehydrogenase [Microbacterium sp.]MCX6503167.1 zinc-binding dehydrogenase [Microbacterium sp.]
MTVPTPTPGPDEVLLEVIACGVCHTDLHVIKGDVAFPRPAVLGHEVSGRVVAIGADTRSDISVGDTVVAAFIMPCRHCAQCLRGRDDLCLEFFRRNRLEGTLFDGESRLRMPDGTFLAMYSMGGLAEYCVVPLSAVTPLPAGLDAVTSCVLGCAGLTSYGAVFRAGEVGEGSSVAIIGVGGVGSSLIPMARAAGATSIVAVDIAADKLERARELGATAMVDATADDPVAAVRALTGGVDVAFEALGRAETFTQALGMLDDGGRLVAIGIAPAGTTAPIEITPLVRRGQQIVGSFGGRTREDLPAVARLAAAGGFDTARLVTRRYALADADAAYTALARGEITGRAVITMQESA